jgi:hypothetical protein
MTKEIWTRVRVRNPYNQGRFWMARAKKATMDPDEVDGRLKNGLIRKQGIWH